MWPRPVPVVGDTSSSAARASQPNGWAFAPAELEAFYRVVEARRDIRHFRADQVPEDLLDRVLAAAHAAPSVGHSQPWRFVVVENPRTRAQAALLADRARLAQARGMDDLSSRHLLDLDLEGVREAPVGIVVCCDRRAPPAGVLGRATYTETDVWSVVCAVQNLWLAAHAEGLGVGWVTLFRPGELEGLVVAPAGVVALGWFCLGWPDERPPAPGLERRGWSERLPLESVVLREHWPDRDAPPAPVSHLAPAAAAVAPPPAQVVAARDGSDRLLTAPGSLGVLDRAIDRAVAAGHAELRAGTLVLVAADHPVVAHGVSAYRASVTRHVVEAAVVGDSVGAVAARSMGLGMVVVDARVDGPAIVGARHLRPAGPLGDLVSTDALPRPDLERLMADGAALGGELSAAGLVVLGEVGVGNTTAAAALAGALLGLRPALAAERLVGLGSGADSAIRATKRAVVAAALERVEATDGAGWETGAGGPTDPAAALAALGGGELAVLAGVTLGAARAGAVVVLDGLATSVAALAAVQLDPGVAAHLVAGQRSREDGHQLVLDALGLEPLLDLRIRAGEGAAGAWAAGLLLAGLEVRRAAARVVEPG